MEARFLARIRVQNPNGAPIACNGLHLEVDLNGRSLGAESATPPAECRGSAKARSDCLSRWRHPRLRQILSLTPRIPPSSPTGIRAFLHAGTIGRVPSNSAGDRTVAGSAEPVRRKERATWRGPRAAERHRRRDAASESDDQGFLAAGRPGHALWYQVLPSLTWLPFLRMRSLQRGHVPTTFTSAKCGEPLGHRTAEGIIATPPRRRDRLPLLPHRER